MFKWKLKAPIAKNAIYLEDSNGKEGRPFKSRFLQAGLVKYDFGVCLLQKETIDKFINTFVGVPVIIDHKDFVNPDDIVGKIQNIWFSTEDGWYWCDGIITNEKAVELIENSYNVSCQYRITDYIENTENKLHNGNPYDKEILNGVFEHLAIVKNPRYEGAFIAANAYIASNGGKGSGNFDHDGRPGEVGGSSDNGDDSGVNPNYKEELRSFIEKAKADSNAREKINVGGISTKLQKDAQANGIDLSEYIHELDVSGTRHAFKNHGDNKSEAARGQIAISDEDFENIPNIVNDYDSVEFGEADKKSTPLIKYRKNFNDGTTYYVEEIRTKHNKLTIKTMYKTKKASNSGIFAEINPQRSVYTSNIIISSNSTDFNPIDFINDLDKGGQMDEKLKELCTGFAKALLKAKNEYVHLADFMVKLP